MARTLRDMIIDLVRACESVQEQVVTPMPDGSYEFEIADHGVHATLNLAYVPGREEK